MAEVLEFPSRPPASTSPDRYLSRVELASHLGCSVKTVDRLVRDGCPSVTFGRRLRRFRLGDVESWMRDRAA